ncbi:hypothetical protein LY78DRAFT_669509 [Colletotrichum sublineola]|uniref:EthD domain-containing protein n=1 Tax=Colletotrichum sublineola TaxID=1173701 RepID=A0A066XYQ0_COLSU|nr:hypothetical protein LY78DRAFT_669509 [Colletotrichum sublineola]KDN70911.1 hypothetical protein CSUB01_03725 [Colletotrichum sublineola]
MMPETAVPIQARRLLRMTVGHYRNPEVTEEDFHRWVTEEHAARAAKIHARNGIEGFSVVFFPQSFREVAADFVSKSGSPLTVRDHDAQVVYLFRDMDTFYKGAADLEFQALRAEEEPYISRFGAEISLGWVEYYVSESKVVNIGHDGKPTYPTFKEASVAP